MNAAQRKPAEPRRVQTSPPASVVSLLEATEEVVAAGQQVILDRIDLIKTEAVEDARAAAVSVSLLVVSVAVLAFGWVMSMVALALGLATFIGPAGGCAAVGIPHLAAGGFLAFRAATGLAKREWALATPPPEPIDAAGRDAAAAGKDTIDAA